MRRLTVVLGLLPILLAGCMGHLNIGYDNEQDAGAVVGGMGGAGGM